MAKKEKDAMAAGGVKISFSSAGNDFHLEVRGGKLDECEQTFERLFGKVKGSKKDEGSHYG